MVFCWRCGAMKSLQSFGKHKKQCVKKRAAEAEALDEAPRPSLPRTLLAGPS